ncbi:dienelactone hydrolase family protein [Reichenbachiella sp.]|uniref:carboxylesterase family protein n=1 Tax=Reichenbachiella sp. TaxID=2184521 RepID=UPI003BAF15FD
MILQYGLIFLLMLLWACDDEDSLLPQKHESQQATTLTPFVAEPGKQVAFLNQSTAAPFGFYLYTPDVYDSTASEIYPLLIHLHGGGARGNSATNPEVLKQLLYDGPPHLIDKGLWAPSQPILVASPQSSTPWDTDLLHEFIGYLIDKLQIDTKRIYMTGFSMGANGCFNYIGDKAEASYAVAIVPIAGWGNQSDADKFKNIGVWAFHGKADAIISHTSSIQMINAINSANPSTEAKLSIYPHVGHNSWARTYNGSGQGTTDPAYDPFDESIYDWLYSFEKP